MVLFQLFGFAHFGCFISVVSVVSSQSFRFVVSGFSACLIFVGVFVFVGLRFRKSLVLGSSFSGSSFSILPFMITDSFDDFAIRSFGFSYLLFFVSTKHKKCLKWESVDILTRLT